MAENDETRPEQTLSYKRKQPDDSPDAKSYVLNKDVDSCQHCGKKCTAVCDAIQCDLRGSWVHAICKGIDKEHYKLLTQVTNLVPNVMYYCQVNNCISN